MSDTLNTDDLKKLELPKALDYNALRKMGIEALQNLSGKVWTDYNEHDPGVTILEQLAFALTDGSYRTTYSMADILQQDPTSRDEGTFFTAGEIMPVNPVLISDYRKLIIDRVPEVKNAWVEPLIRTQDVREIDGLFLVYLELLTKSGTPEDEQQAIDAVKAVLQKHCNVFEACQEVVVLDPETLAVTSSIEIAQDADVNIVHADVLNAIGTFFNQPIEVQSMTELMDDGKTLAEIFDGPIMENGFIQNDQLLPVPHVIYNSQLIRVIKDVNGVNSVRSLKVEPYGLSEEEVQARTLPDGVLVDLNLLPYIDISQAKETIRISYYKRNIQTTYDQVVVNQRLTFLEADNQEASIKATVGAKDVEVPNGTFRDLTKYSSIQNNFPGVYGIGPLGLPKWVDNRRKAQAKQLKAYLLFFEQLMTDYMAQLAHVNDLFSLNPSIDQTYFGQSLANDVPDVEAVLQGRATRLQMATQFNLEMSGDNVMEYEQSLQHLIKTLDPFDDRRGRFLNHLLARFAEEVTQISGSNQSFLTGSESTSEFDRQNKIKFLTQYPQLSRDRAVNFDPTQPFWGTENISGPERRVKLILGIDLPPRKLSTNTQFYVLEFDVNGYELGANQSNRFDPISMAMISTGFEPVDLPQVGPLQVPTPEELATRFPADFQLNKGLFQLGTDASKYRIGPNPVDQGATAIVVFTPDDGQTWWVIGRFSSSAAARAAVTELISRIIDQNQKGENFLALDHLQLRLESNQSYYGLYFVPDDNGNQGDFRPDFRSHQTYKFAELQEQLNDLVYLAQQDNGSHFAVEATEAGRYTVRLYDPGKVVMGETVESFDNEVQANDHLNALRVYFDSTHFTKLDRYDWQKVRLYTHNELENEFLGLYYSMRYSVVLPSWPGRFSNTEFRSLLQRVFVESLPAHGTASFLWLERQPYAEYESLFTEWLALKADPNASVESRNEASAAILSFLLEYGKDYRDPINAAGMVSLGAAALKRR